eukprot:Awhi_evm1s9979
MKAPFPTPSPTTNAFVRSQSPSPVPSHSSSLVSSSMPSSAPGDANLITASVPTTSSGSLGGGGTPFLSASNARPNNIDNKNYHSHRQNHVTTS